MVRRAATARRPWSRQPGAHHRPCKPGGPPPLGPPRLALVPPAVPPAARLAGPLIEKAVGPAERSRPGEDGGVRVSEERRAAAASPRLKQ